MFVTRFRPCISSVPMYTSDIARPHGCACVCACVRVVSRAVTAPG